MFRSFYSGYLKSIVSQNIELKPETCKIFFGGVEKDKDEGLQVAGVMNNSEVLLVEVMECDQIIHEEVQETSVISKGEGAVAEVRKEVDKLAQQVSALQAVVDSGNKVDDKEIIYLTEMLMRQLLKLDGIEAEGEGKVQRKMEVHRVQSIVEALDTLKSRNSNSFICTPKNLSVATQWRAFDSGCQSVNISSPMPSSSSAPSPVPHFMPPTMPSSTFLAVPYSVATLPSSTPSHLPYYDPSQISHCTPSNLPSSTPSPVPYYVPSHMPPSAPFSVPSSSQVTQNWEHFD